MSGTNLLFEDFLSGKKCAERVGSGEGVGVRVFCHGSAELLARVEF